MYERYVFMPAHLHPQELKNAIAIVRPFLSERQPNLHHRVEQARLNRAMGRIDWHPQTIAEHALRKDRHSNLLCDILTSQWGQIALWVLAAEFPMPGMKVLRDVLPLAATALCTERRQNTATALGWGAIGLGALMVLAALAKPQPAT